VIQRGDRLNAKVHRDPDTAWGVAVLNRSKTRALPSAESVYRPDHAESELSDPRLVPDVEGGFREEATGNCAWISKAAQSGELEGEVRATPNDDHGRVSRGEQNTLRRSNIEVGEGNPIVEIREVILPIQTGRLERETEISSSLSLSKSHVAPPASGPAEVSALAETSAQQLVRTNAAETSEEEPRSQTQVDTASTLLGMTREALPSVDTQSSTTLETDVRADMTGSPVFGGGKLSRSQIQAETDSALLDKASRFRKTLTSPIETQSDAVPELDDAKSQEHCYHKTSVYEGDAKSSTSLKSQQGGP
jgi:hypothetical protein